MIQYPPLSAFMKHTRIRYNIGPFYGKLLCFDPGLTTGWALFDVQSEMPALIKCGQLETPEVGNFVDRAIALVKHEEPKFVVYEQYRVYSWLLQQHSFSDIPTLRMVGVLEGFCHYWGVGSHGQPANIAKNFVTDEKLKHWNLWQPGQKHARDAIRHGLYYLMFGNKEVDANGNPIKVKKGIVQPMTQSDLDAQKNPEV